ncbi:MAG: cbb3-type cytochrome c oxidase subunit I [Deltaproteobacteria bacterium]|nr:cbb3-type cytochrome c oxidase subunit I [Deltaproteobacteria bacterium]
MSEKKGFSLKEWIFTTDHKRVGILYLIGSLAAFAVAGIMAVLIRLELWNVGPTITDNPSAYNTWLYFHGAAMILGFQIPALTGFLANYLIPLQIGARDVAFPRLNALSVWLFFMGIVLALLTFVIPDPPDIMWTGYPPYSIVSPGNTAFYTFTVLLIGFSSIAGGVNFLTTIIKMRAPGMGWNQMNLFVWGTMGAFIIQLIFVPVLGTAVTMLTFDKYLGTQFFSAIAGGDVLIYQNLFWFYSHPAVYVIFLPFFTIIMEIVATFAKNRPFNYKVAVYGGIWVIVLISGEVWAHHLYTSGLVDWLRVGQMVTTLLISVPVGLMVISLVGTLYKGAITVKTPMLYAIGFIFLFLVGGLTGIPLAMLPLDINFQDTQFVTAHFHYVMAVSGTFAIFAAVYYIFPKMTGKMYNETWGWIGFFVSFIGVNITFFTMFIPGLEGLPRRYYDYELYSQFVGHQQLMTIGGFIIGLGAVIIYLNWIIGAIAGKKAPGNPWGSKSLEWQTPQTPPAHGNWGPELPKLSKDWTPYNYSE